ncbi:serine palmitoyltransferase small subunit A-like [Musca domestica]|uniref:Serine palmitoyltransferase small subunit B n=1 Tax=Musca domestica TaxID=7370 RepID=A0A9J7CM74_MUSDO|nr:serine palmitoyltransferase small subunit A [Musca domestica]XP_058981460.1 serine palmitoyltransferase small subunit A-like [Musca domestica]
MLQFLKKSLINLYLQYELVTNIYMFEPWEKKLINGFVAIILSLVIFSSYFYLPSYIETFLQFITPQQQQSQQGGISATGPAASYAAPILQAEKISIS